MDYNFRKQLAPQKAVRLHVDDAEEVERIAKKEGTTQDEVIREFVRHGVSDYLGRENAPH